ncbi:sulfurtransferase, partial [Yeosuana marina]|uniref:sulfurtransferase n=1 Tax=Yeosuana marina TaxID=1565536 RepID=UPI0030C8AFC4
SVNLPYEDLLEGNVLKPRDVIEAKFRKMVQKEAPIIFSCGSGITACVLALGAEMSGYKNISVYDGSWTEWGSLVPE